MERIELEVKERTVQGKQVNRLRAGGWIPAVVYGPDTPAQKIQIDERVLYRTLQQVGSTALISLNTGTGNPSLVLARDIQRDAITGRLLHVDFYQVRMTEKVKTMPRIELVGDAPVVKGGEAVLVQAMTEIEVECLPDDLINSVEVDITSLQTLDDSIFVSDLKVPAGVTILLDPGEVVVSVVATRAAEAEADADELEGLAEVERVTEEEAAWEE